MIILQIAFQDPSQMPFSQHDYMIQAVTPDGSGQPLHQRPLPWTGWSGEDFLDTHASDPLAKVITIVFIPIPEQVTRCRILWKRPHHLLSCPQRGRMLRQVEANDAPPMMGQNDKDKQRSKANGRHREEIDRH